MSLNIFISFRVDATNTHFDIANRFEEVMRSRVGKLTVSQEWPLRVEDTRGKSLVVCIPGTDPTTVLD